MANKASMESLNALHDAVAKALMKNIDDPKTLANAIKFLKDNDITVDIMESEVVNDLQSTIKEHLQSANKPLKMSVNDMIELSS